MIDIYPLTIIADRYGGVYSGGAYLAFNLYPCEIPDEVEGSDLITADFWSQFYQDEIDIKIGIGQTPDEAYEDLKQQLI